MSVRAMRLMPSVILLFVGAFRLGDVAEAAHLAMGFRVGEVTQDSAIVWTRLTRDAERNWTGFREPDKREEKNDAYVESPVSVDDRHGATPGARGQVRVRYGTNGFSCDEGRTEWVSVTPENDFVHQFRLNGLRPNTRYGVCVEARDAPGAIESTMCSGSFRTPAPANQWQDVSFAVVTGQSYWDVDHPQGYHIYPAMQRLNPHFIVPTGDTVYLDSEAPRARTIDLARFHWHRMYSLPRHVEFHRHVPGYWERDDHDTWCNDCWPSLQAAWMNPLTFEQGIQVYREQVPVGDEPYRTVRWGRGLQIWLVEGRDFRSPNDMPDGPDKTIWGKQQLEWLKRTILESDAEFRVLISPTPIVGPDRSDKSDNHSNAAFAHEGNHFRRWARDNNLDNFYVCCGDRHWQYMSIDPETKLREFSCGPASDVHASGSPGQDPAVQPFHRELGGFLTVSIFRDNGVPTAAFRHHDVYGNVVHEFQQAAGIGRAP